MSHKKFGPRSVQPVWRLLDTNKQTNRQTDRQTDKPNLYIEDDIHLKTYCKYCKYCKGVNRKIQYNWPKKSTFLACLFVTNKCQEIAELNFLVFLAQISFNVQTHVSSCKTIFLNNTWFVDSTLGSPDWTVQLNI